MTKLTDVFPLADLEAALADGYVRRQVHPDDDRLVILNYTEKAQFDRWWTDVTTACRGLIYNTETLEVLARPFPKFHNWDEGGQPYPPPGPVVIMDKMDGCLGILYAVSDTRMIATRGSFASEQAIKGSEMYHRTRSDNWVGDSFPEMRRFTAISNKTYLFEIIYPENRIVVDYHGIEQLTLLDVVDNATGLPDMGEFDACAWPNKVRRRLESKGFYPQLLEEETLEGEEGLVLLWPATGYRVKMKRADYVHLHRLVTGLDERKVWNAMRSHLDITKFCEPLPDEFHQWVRDVWERIQGEQNAILKEVYGAWAEIRSGLREDYTRKEFASKTVQHPHRGFIFSVEDGKDIKDAVLDTLEPAGNQYAARQTEETA